MTPLGLCAAAAGQPFALFTKGYRKTSIESLSPEYYFHDFNELKDIVNLEFKQVSQ